MNSTHKRALIFSLYLFSATQAWAQMPRERSQNTGLVEELFWSPSIVLLPSVTQLAESDLEFTIQHAFGNVSTGISGLYGLDDAANIRFGLDYGVRDWLSVGVGRSRFLKVYDARVKARLFGGEPAQISIFSDVGVETPEDGRSFNHKLSYFSGLLAARRVSERVSVQIMPAFSHFNLVENNELLDGTVEEEENDHFVLGLAARLEMSDQSSINIEYLPVLGARSDETEDVISIGINLETGGHVFQMFFTSTQWITPQHAVSKSRYSFFDGDFGFGFNVHRVF